MQAQFPIQRHLNPFVDYDCTAYIEQMEKGLVVGFQRIAMPTRTYLMAFAYLVLFSSIVAFTSIVLAYTEKTAAIKRVSLVFVLNYLIAFPFYLLLPVTVTGYVLPGVQPHIYELHLVIIHNHHHRGPA